MTKTVLCSLLSVLACTLVQTEPASGQSNDQYPPSIRWRQLDAAHARVIFDAELEPSARVVGGLLDYIYEPTATTLRRGSRRIPVVLGAGNTANGYVSLTPRVTEWGSRPFFPGSRPGLATGDWYELLAVHEYRHVVQIHTMDRGFSRLMRFVYGNLGLSISTNLAVPNWFWEGDAVVEETAFTASGRGRMPTFDLHVRALLSEGKRYHYQKAMFRTYGDYYPNHYVLGYLLAGYVKKTYGPSAWKRIITRANNLAFLPLSFSLAMKGVTGRSAQQVYDDAMTDFGVAWSKKRSTLVETPVAVALAAEGKRWTNYAHPQYLPDGSIVTVESGSQRTGVLWRIWPDGQVEKLGGSDPALYFNGFSTAANKIFWHSARRHPRWGKLQYSVIMVRDVWTGKERQLTQQSFYYVPSVSPDGTRIAVVEFDRRRKCRVVVLDSDGRFLQGIDSPGNQLVTSIAWMHDGERLVVNRQSARDGKAISVVNLRDGSFEDIRAHSFDDSWRLTTYRDYALFNSPRGGISQIDAVDISTGEQFAVVTRRLGAYYPSVSADGSHLTFSDYSAAGLSVVVTRMDPTTWEAIGSDEQADDDLIEELVEQETGGETVDLSAAKSLEGESKRYNRIRDLINIYSWTPVADDESVALALTSTNLLNTVALRFGGLYNYKAETSLGFAEVRYSGLFPTLAGRVQFGERTDVYLTEPGVTQRESWRETSIATSAAIPLVFDRGRTVHGAVFEVGLRSTSVSQRDIRPTFEIGNGSFLSSRYAASYTKSRAMAVNDIVPSWRSSVFVSFEHSLASSDFGGYQTYVSLTQNFPGLRPQHALRFGLEFELQDPNEYRYDRIVSLARGYNSLYADERYRASASYVLPVWYPDVAIGSVFYSNRLLAVGFADYSMMRGTGQLLRRNSVGVELMADVRILSIPVPIRAGVRVAYRFEDQRFRTEPVLFF